MFLAEDEVIRVKNKCEKQNLTDFPALLMIC